VYYSGNQAGNTGTFRSSLAVSRVLEDPPGELPVIVAYRMNGQPIPVSLGGPVRMVVPGTYGNKWIKWLQQVVLTNEFQANDTYAEMNNDTESPMKTQARFLQPPKEIAAGRPVALTGLAQVGMSGLAKVQFSVHAKDEPWAAGDPYGTKADWQDGIILPPPREWGGGLPDGKLPPAPAQIDPASGRPRVWPMRYSIVHWAAVLQGLPAGSYNLCCRAVDLNGVAQPMPRPFPRTGANGIQKVTLTVT
jgi:hypothetical protein